MELDDLGVFIEAKLSQFYVRLFWKEKKGTKTFSNKKGDEGIFQKNMGSNTFFN